MKRRLEDYAAKVGFLNAAYTAMLQGDQPSDEIIEGGQLIFEDLERGLKELAEAV